MTSTAISQFFDESSPLKRLDFSNPYLQMTKVHGASVDALGPAGLKIANVAPSRND